MATRMADTCVGLIDRLKEIIELLDKEFKDASSKT
jgi:hypothetical protein